MTTQGIDCPPGHGQERWTRRQLLRAVAGIGCLAALLATGLGYALYLALTGSPRTSFAEQTAVVVDLGPPAAVPPEGPGRRDAIAAAPMLTVPPQAAREGTPTSRRAEAIAIPPAGHVGPADMASGYPRTPNGALGQLAAITVSVLQDMSIEHARSVYQRWTQPGAPPFAQWELTAAVQAFGSTAAAANSRTAPVTITVTPVAAQVKGVDGPDWTLACVLFEVHARAASTATIAFGHCARMHWDDRDSRWVIAAGPAPARAPSTWPGTDLAIDAGWRTWVPAEHR